MQSRSPEATEGLGAGAAAPLRAHWVLLPGGLQEGMLQPEPY
jgi:hypothetical protein